MFSIFHQPTGELLRCRVSLTLAPSSDMGRKAQCSYAFVESLWMTVYHQQIWFSVNNDSIGFPCAVT